MSRRKGGLSRTDDVIAAALVTDLPLLLVGDNHDQESSVCGIGKHFSDWCSWQPKHGSNARSMNRL